MGNLAFNTSAIQACAPISNKEFILVIEENPAITDMIRYTLELAGYPVRACSGEKASLASIHHALEVDNLPALILLDVNILPTNISDFLSHLRAQLSEARCRLPAIILLTTSKIIHDRFMTTERVILKPFHISDLIAEVQKVF
jgi:DNA-binding response OmpR family regulator